MYNQIGH